MSCQESVLHISCAPAWNMQNKCLFKATMGHCRNVFSSLPLNNFFPFSLDLLPAAVLRSPWQVSDWCIKVKKEVKVKCVKNRLLVGAEWRLTVRQRQLRLQRLSRGLSSRAVASWWCIAAVAGQVRASVCSVMCDAPCSQATEGRQLKLWCLRSSSVSAGWIIHHLNLSYKHLLKHCKQ